MVSRKDDEGEMDWLNVVLADLKRKGVGGDAATLAALLEKYAKRFFDSLTIEQRIQLGIHSASQ